ncbi:MAG: hypothetical protein HDR89_01120 [Bacteroides sp.]|nr:hypothetical protein [Bacteroides sp.]
MKKILSLLILAAAALSASAAQPADTQATDSLAYYLGTTQGVGYNNRLRQQSAPDQYPSKRANYLAGAMAALSADTAATDYYDGFAAGRSFVDAMKEMKKDGYPINIDIFNKCFAEAFMRDDVTEDQFRQLMAKTQELMEPMTQALAERTRAAQEAQQSAQKQLAQTNREAGKAYIDSLLAADKSYTQTPSGLVYKIIKKGKGKNVGPSQKADVRYTGKFIDGKVFDSSGDRTATFGPSDVIKGFGEGLQLLNKGAKAILVIPGNIAYGPNGAGGVIGPDQTLIFEIEVADIK